MRNTDLFTFGIYKHNTNSHKNIIKYKKLLFNNSEFSLQYNGFTDF